MRIEGIYVLTDNTLRPPRSHLDIAQSALAGGARLIQLRDKHANTRQLIEWARAIVEMTRQYGALFFVNDRVDVALAVEADGVHIGDDDMPLPLARKLLGKGKLIGRSVSNAEEAKIAEQQGADYVSVGSVFATATKPDAGEPIGVEAIRAVKAEVKVPVVAIGGITKQNVAAVFEAGADAAAVISAVAAADDMAQATKELVLLWHSSRRIK